MPTSAMPDAATSLRHGYALNGAARGPFDAAHPRCAHVTDRHRHRQRHGNARAACRLQFDARPTAVPITTASPGDFGGSGLLTLRRRHVTSVATDPAFPDPRMTPEPTIAPTLRPVPKATPTPTLPPPPPEPTDVDQAPYTSPPLAFPLVKHSPGETSPPDDVESPDATSTP